jgi:hypothetical protein
MNSTFPLLCSLLSLNSIIEFLFMTKSFKSLETFSLQDKNVNKSVSKKNFIVIFFNILYLEILVVDLINRKRSAQFESRNNNLETFS